MYARKGTRRTMDGMVTHIATRECRITQRHPGMECGVVAARRRCQQEADSAMRRQHEDEQRPAVRGGSPMAPITMQRFLKELDKLKQDTDAGTIKEQDYDS